MKQEGGCELARLARLSDAALLGEVSRVSRAHRRLTAELVVHLAEMDQRKLYLRDAKPSMFAWCVERLGFSEDEACRRIEAARLGRKWPVIFGKIADSALSLSVLGKLKPFLTNENVDELLNAVSGKSVRDAERILASRFPKPDVPDSIRKLPEPRAPSSATVAESRSASGSASVTAAVKQQSDRGKMSPLSAERVQVKFTASRELEEKLVLARDLMSHRNPAGDLATVVEAGLDLLIAELLKKKLGVTKRGQKKRRPAQRGHITSATRRAVLERDGLGCSFVNEKGERCGARAFLELDHREAKGRGGGSEASNVRILCAAHNQHEAERVYGKAHMDESRRKGKKSHVVRERVSTPDFVVGFARLRESSDQPKTFVRGVAGEFQNRGMSCRAGWSLEQRRSGIGSMWVPGTSAATPG
jgi:hypothetical protein